MLAAASVAPAMRTKALRVVFFILAYPGCKRGVLEHGHGPDCSGAAWSWFILPR